MWCFLGVITLFVVIEADPVSFITKCKLNDDNCLKTSSTATIPFIAAGIPEFGMAVQDPKFFKRIDSSSPVVNFLVDDVTVKGFRNCIVTKAHRDVKHSKISLKVLCATGTLDSQYMLSGKLLKVAIEGHGKFHVDLKGGEIGLEMYLSNVNGKDGKNHWHIKNWTYTYDLKGQTNVYFENLFNKDSYLGQTAQEMVSSNGNAIVKDIGHPIITEIVSNIMEQVKRFFAAVPSEDLSID